MTHDPPDLPTDELDPRAARAAQQRAERRAEVLTAALETFGAKGFHATSISDICAAAGVARGTFYQYFDSKHAIFMELLDALFTGLRASVVGMDTTPGAAPMDVQLAATVQRILDAAWSSRAVATIIVREAVVLDEAITARVREFEQRLHGYIRGALENGQRLGLLRTHDPDVAATCVFGAIRQVIYDRLVAREAAEEGDTAALAAEVVRFCLSGLRA